MRDKVESVASQDKPLINILLKDAADSTEKEISDRGADEERRIGLGRGEVKQHHGEHSFGMILVEENEETARKARGHPSLP